MHTDRRSTWCASACYKSDLGRFQAPTVCCSHLGKHVEKDLFLRNVRFALLRETIYKEKKRWRLFIGVVADSMSTRK